MNSIQNQAYVTGMEARFAAAARHSRMVRVLRVAVPAAVLLAMAGIVLISVFNPWRITGLPKDSVANVSQIVTIDRDFLMEPAGRLRGQLLKTIESGLCLVLGL